MPNYLGELKNNIFDQDWIYSKLIFPYSLSSRGKTKYSELTPIFFSSCHKYIIIFHAKVIEL